MKILLSRQDRLGDLILSTPAIRSFRRSFPQAHITLACSERNAIAVQGNLDLDAVQVIPEDKWLNHARALSGIDLAVALAPRQQDLLFVGATWAQRRIGYTYVRRWGTRLLAQLVLTDRAISQADPVLCDAEPARAVLHEVDQLLELVRISGGKEIARELVLIISAADRLAVAKAPADAVVVHLAPRWLTQGSTEENFVRLLQDLRVYRRPIIVSYAPECDAVAQRIKEAVVADAVIGNLRFAEWAALFARACCVVTVDTSATHVASAVGRPTVVLFEHAYYHLNSREWAPYRVPAAMIRKPRGESSQELERSRKEVVAAVGRLLAA